MIALFVDAVEEERILVGEIGAEEQPRKLFVFEGKVKDPFFLGLRG